MNNSGTTRFNSQSKGISKDALRGKGKTRGASFFVCIKKLILLYLLDSKYGILKLAQAGNLNFGSKSTMSKSIAQVWQNTNATETKLMVYAEWAPGDYDTEIAYMLQRGWAVIKTLYSDAEIKEYEASKIKQLKADDNVRLAAWPFQYAIVRTTRAYYAGHKETVPQGEPLEAWIIFAGTCLSSDPGFYARENAKHAAATVIEDGEMVIIEGLGYIVRVVKGNEQFPRNSDPIKFEPLNQMFDAHGNRDYEAEHEAYIAAKPCGCGSDDDNPCVCN